MQTDPGFSHIESVRVLQAGVSLSEPCSQDLSADFDARELVGAVPYSKGVQGSTHANTSARGRLQVTVAEVMVLLQRTLQQQTAMLGCFAS